MAIGSALEEDAAVDHQLGVVMLPIHLGRSVELHGFGGPDLTSHHTAEDDQGADLDLGLDLRLAAPRSERRHRQSRPGTCRRCAPVPSNRSLPGRTPARRIRAPSDELLEACSFAGSHQNSSMRKRRAGARKWGRLVDLGERRHRAFARGVS